MSGTEATVESEAPVDRHAAAALMARLAGDGQAMRILGGGTKLGWGSPVTGAAVELSTAKLNEIREHNEGDYTAVVEAGVPLAQLQARVAGAGQRLALDPALGDDERATIGGILATADAGPLRHRYGAVRDLVLGVTVALPDGSIAKAGGKVIKNVAGYDLPKLYAGSFGTLGLIVEAVVRLHPLPESSLSVLGRSTDPDAVAAAAWALADSALEPDALDVRWGTGRTADQQAGGGRVHDAVADNAGAQAAGDREAAGAVLVRLAGSEAPALAERARKLIAEHGIDGELLEDDEATWRAQREGQRSASGAVLRVSAEPAVLASVLGMAQAVGASVVGRAAHGVSWLRFEPRADDELIDAIDRARTELEPAYSALLDAPSAVRQRIDPFGLDGLPEQRLMRSVKERFDPGNACNPGLMGAGI